MVGLCPNPGWKAPPVARIALFEPQTRFIDNENQIAQDALISFEKGIVSITISNTNHEVFTIYKDTTLGLSQLVSDRLIMETKPKQMENYDKVEPKYDLEKVKKAKNKEINNNCRADYRTLIDDFSDIFSINQWNLGNWDATSHRIDVKPGSQPLKLPIRRMPVHYKDDLKIENLLFCILTQLNSNGSSVSPSAEWKRTSYLLRI